MRAHAADPRCDWPAELTLVRHGESAGNVARDAAYAAAQATIAVTGRDCDVPLSGLGRTQAAALGRRLRECSHPPDAVLASPYARALHTAELAIDAAGWDRARLLRTDERLREKEFGILDRLTRWGIAEQYPEQVTARRDAGKFYYRPPGGESWVDVILRVRSFVETLRRDFSGAHVLVVAHQVVILALRYVLEELDEARILAIDRQGDIGNCSVTHYAFDDARGAMRLTEYNSSAALQSEGAAITREPPAGNER